MSATRFSPAGSRPAVSVSTFHGPGLPVIRVAGEIDLATAPLLDRHLTATIGPRTPDVVVDLSAVSFMDASGLSVLVRAANQARRHGGRVCLTPLPERLERLLHITRLHSFFPRVAAGRRS